MAARDDLQGRQFPRRARPLCTNDWLETDEPIATFSPRRTLLGDTDVPDFGTISSSSYRRPGPSAKVPTTHTRSSLTRSSSTSMRNPSAAVPGLSRAATLPHQHRWPAHIYDDEDNARSDSRRSGSRRDTSPPSAPLYRSMAGSRPSSRTSLSDPDADTDSATSSSEETPGKHVYSKRTPAQPLPPPRVPKPPKSHKGVIYEEDVAIDRHGKRPRLRREDTLLQEEERRRSRSKSKPRRQEELLYPEECDREAVRARSHTRRADAGYDFDSEPEPLPELRRGKVIYEEDCEVHEKTNPFLEGLPTASRGPSRGPSRAASRAPSIRQAKAQGSSSGRDLRRSSTMDRPLSRSPSRQRLSKRLGGKYYESEVVSYESRPSSARKARTTAGSSSQSTHSSARRSSSFLGSFFGPAIQAHHYDRPVKLVECVVCMEDDLPAHRTARLKCGHRMCNSCLKESFRLSVRDPQHMPPKCCTADHIPLKHVERLFDTSFKRHWNRKYAEFSTRNRIYCPSRRCGEWIKPEHIHRDADGRKYAKCGRCHTKVCYACNGRWHGSRDCPRDEETHRFLEQAKQQGWQRCHRCKAMVELKEGCNHMTCRCGAEFCMICGSKWKTCDCPWFSQDAVEADRLEHMQVPMHLRSEPTSMRSIFYDAGSPSPRDFRPGSISATPAARPRPQSYEEELLLRRLQEQRDDRSPRRVRTRERYDDYEDIDDDNDYAGRIGDIHGIGHQAGHHMNDDYRRRPETLIVPPAPHTEIRGAPPQSPYDRTTVGGTDYVSGVHRARGVQASSLERRLADRFNTDLRSGPMRTPVYRGPPQPLPPMLKTAATMPIMPMPMMPMGGGHLHPLPSIAPVRRRHTMEEELYTTHASPPRSAPRPGSGRTRVHRRTDDFEEEEEEDMTTPPAVVATSSRRSGRRHREATRDHRREPDEPPRPSTMAGLTGPARGMDRVFEWVNYVEDGPPQDEERMSTTSA